MTYIAGITVSVFVAALLLTKKGKSQADLFLLVWMIINALHLALQYTMSTGLMMEYPVLYGLVAPLPLIHGVMLYFYVSSVTNQGPKNKYAFWIHLIPITLAYLYLLIFYFFLPVGEQRFILENKGAGHEIYSFLLGTGIMLSGVIYVVWSIVLLQKHKKNILDNFSGLEKVDLKWLQFIIYGLGALWCLVIFAQRDDLIFYGVVLFVILMGFFGLQQIDIFKNRENQLPNDQEPESKEKYAKSGLSAEASTGLYQNLSNLIEKEKIYTRQELTIGDLADMLDTNPNYLSQVINEKAGKRFYDYINMYRVEEFKSIVQDPKKQQFTMLALAYECGFNSKSSFNRYFKKATGSTPSEYLKTIKAA